MQASMIFVGVAALNGLVATACGAFGAHALRAQLSSEALETWQTAVQYQFVHALALLAIGIACLHLDAAGLRWAGALMLVGILLFSGSLYLLTLTEWRWPGPVTPVGGGLLILAWAVLAFTALRLAPGG